MSCAYCRSIDHTTEYCPKTWQGSTNRKHLRCGYCGSNKHNTDGCPKTWGSGKDAVVLKD